MKVSPLLLMLILLFSVSAFAAQLYGGFREGEHAIPRGVPVTVICGDHQHQGQTDDDGSYRIYVPETGRCILKIAYNGQEPSIEVYSFADPTKYDFDIVRQGATYSLRRR